MKSDSISEYDDIVSWWNIPIFKWIGFKFDDILLFFFHFPFCDLSFTIVHFHIGIVQMAVRIHNVVDDEFSSKIMLHRGKETQHWHGNCGKCAWIACYVSKINQNRDSKKNELNNIPGIDGNNHTQIEWMAVELVKIRMIDNQRIIIHYRWQSHEVYVWTHNEQIKCFTTATMTPTSQLSTWGYNSRIKLFSQWTEC